GMEPDPQRAIAACRQAGLQVLAADAGTGRDLDDVVDAGTLAVPTAWLFGNEAHGLDRELLAAADHAVAIPLHGRAESLNLATAAAVCLYASARAHRRQPGPGGDHLRSDQN
ncbi:MAG: TrmH family RNA methyltransferase, partial [Pseudonocardiaceae bacterium]